MKATLFSLLLLSSISSLLIIEEASARPRYANEVGKKCAFCHIGEMGSKNFTSDGLEYCKYLKKNGILPASSSCTRKALDLYDASGNYIGNYTVCVPDPPPC
ncbi:hypothetical protein VSS37_09020 [Candidatus Thiothrix sp. Deng01]|uniref:Cytochrome c domain-containing protein n=1 Tax=Candidatus Thiothrix phosphatis TaxID=3112415 RepID=A0ABU6CW95_9GAMM|nr:hypothetical protein [Candidatus Thiothrix sp. Deng01]MEB4591117.1 hypothetical protein [Candidatus Thiothrix sp. Deng01]